MGRCCCRFFFSIMSEFLCWVVFLISSFHRRKLTHARINIYYMTRGYRWFDHRSSSILTKANCMVGCFFCWFELKRASTVSPFVEQSCFIAIIIMRQDQAVHQKWTTTATTNIADRSVDEKKIESRMIFIVLWHIVQCRQKHVNWCAETTHLI